MSELPPIDFASLFAGSPNPYVVVDRDLTIAWMNDAYLDATMRRRDDILGKPMFEAFPSDPKSESFRLLNDSFERVLQTGERDEIALIRYDITNRHGELETRYWSATHTPVKDASGSAAFILQHTVDVTELHSLRHSRDQAGVVQRADAIQAQNRDLAEERDRFRRMFQQAPGFVAVVGGPRHVFLMANAAYHRLVGERDLIGKPAAEALPEVVEQGFIELLDRVRLEGKVYVGEREPIMLRGEGSGSLNRRYLTFVYQPIFDAGDVTAIFVQGYDVTDEVEASEAQKLLIHELNHRVKNTLAIVQGLAAQSFRNLDGAGPGLTAFDARLNALAAAHSLLTESNWEAACLENTICRAIEATLGSEARRVTLAGPSLSLPPQTTVSLAMLVHELSTNALKYGALSNASGTIEVQWEVSGDSGNRQVQIEWRESGGPRVEKPARRGFGTRLIERGLSTEGGAGASIEFNPAGLHCTVITRIGENA